MEFLMPSPTILTNSPGFPGLGGNSMTLVKLALILILVKASIPESKRLAAMVMNLAPCFARLLVNGKVSDANASFDAA